MVENIDNKYSQKKNKKRNIKYYGKRRYRNSL